MTPGQEELRRNTFIPRVSEHKSTIIIAGQTADMRDIQEIEYDEVCNVLAVTPTNLRVMLHRARKLMRRCLETNWIGA